MPKPDEIAFPVPPVCTAAWTDEDWARWIERHGRPRWPETMTCCGVTYRRTDEMSPDGSPIYQAEP